jgi:stage V sporulation SpoS-like protein
MTPYLHNQLNTPPQVSSLGSFIFWIWGYQMSVIKASVKSQVPDLAGSLVQGIHEQKRAEIQAIGPQAFKAEGINILPLCQKL